jgi:transcriptional regulator with XRE-family HTH domain
MNLGQAIADVRRRKCLKQKVVARKCQISQTYLSQIENNRRDPTLSTLKKISQVLEVPLPIIFFLSLTDEDIPDQKKEAFAFVLSSVKAFVQEFFSDSLQQDRSV